MDPTSYAILSWLMGSLEAASFGEVIRRALQAYEFFEPEDLAESSRVATGESSEPSTAGLRHVHARIPMRTKERLDREKAVSGGTYSDVVCQSLRVLAQLVRDREVMLKGGECMGPSAVSRDTNCPDRHWLAVI